MHPDLSIYPVACGIAAVWPPTYLFCEEATNFRPVIAFTILTNAISSSSWMKLLLVVAVGIWSGLLFFFWPCHWQCKSLIFLVLCYNEHQGFGIVREMLWVGDEGGYCSRENLFIFYQSWLGLCL